MCIPCQTPRRHSELSARSEKMDGVKKVDISEDLREMDIDADAAEFSTVMDRVVNICNKVSYGCEVKYKFS